MEKNFIEFHIDISKSLRFNKKILEFIRLEQTLKISDPKGHAWFRKDANRPILLIAGGVGFSYIRSILFTSLICQPDRKITMYWGGKKQDHLYELKELKVLFSKYPKSSIIPVVEEPNNVWRGRTGNVLSAVMRDYNDLRDYDIYIAGSFEMSKTARRIFSTLLFADVNRIFSDAFYYDRKNF